jgi:hypothetical protein
VRDHPQDRQTCRRPARGPRPHPTERTERSRNYDAVTDLVGERVQRSHGKITAKRLLPIAPPQGRRRRERGDPDPAIRPVRRPLRLRA